ncbi:MAG: GspE/PulE family protein [Bacillota bacterium]|jgi:type IV pilus assembly protein PilB
MYPQRHLLGEVIRDLGFINQFQLEEALQEQKNSGKRLGEVLLEKGYLTEEALLSCLEQHLGISRIGLSQINLNGDQLELIPLSIIQRHQVVPVKIKDNQLILAMVDPLNVLAIEDVRMASGYEVIPVLISPREIKLIINRLVSLRARVDLEKAAQSLKEDTESYLAANQSELRTQEPAIEPLVVKIVNGVINQGVVSRASDIHIEPQEKELRIRYRIDGVLHEAMSLPLKSHGSIVSRVKIMANLDIAERRLPQDGRIHLSGETNPLDLRISTLPTVFGEKVMLRILDRRETVPTIDKLDLRGSNLINFKDIISRSAGLILVCGPTGSGKTTTLYSLLTFLNSVTRNMITLEDPVECIIPGINQVQINSRSCFGFASGLRSVLRQDPDVIMVGEIRDRETAELAVRAAITGHLVLSTIHTRRAAGAVTRLIDMGIEPYLLMSSLVGVIAQRLVRRVCLECGTPIPVTVESARQLGINPENAQLRQGQGCSWCGDTGYWGRMAIHEVMVITPEIQELIRQQVPEGILEKTAVAQGMITLRQDGLDKALLGETAIEEVLNAVDQY